MSRVGRCPAGTERLRGQETEWTVGALAGQEGRAVTPPLPQTHFLGSSGPKRRVFSQPLHDW